MEHVCLLKAKEGLSEEVEKDMLDYLYTTQYQMRGIVAISVGECPHIIDPKNLCVCVCKINLYTLLSQVVSVIETLKITRTLSSCDSRGRKTLASSMRTLSS